MFTTFTPLNSSWRTAVHPVLSIKNNIKIATTANIKFSAAVNQFVSNLALAPPRIFIQIKKKKNKNTNTVGTQLAKYR